MDVCINTTNEPSMPDNNLVDWSSNPEFSMLFAPDGLEAGLGHTFLVV